MKIKITKQIPDEAQRFFSQPLSFPQKVEVKKLWVVEQLLQRMKELKINRTTLAERMEVSNARITSMLNGTNNFTIETLMRAADAVDGELALTIAPKNHQVKWITYSTDDIHASFQPRPTPSRKDSPTFVINAPLADDLSDAA